MLLKEQCDRWDLGRGKCLVKFGVREYSLILGISQVKKLQSTSLGNFRRSVKSFGLVGGMGL